MRNSSSFLPRHSFAKYLLFLLPVFILINCDNCGNAGYTFDAASIINMEKTPCFGACPTFTFEINGKGEATYKGDANVDKLGNYTKVFTADETNKIFQTFVDADFWSFQDEYTGNVTDLPTTFLQFKHDGNDKRIRMYYDVPQELRDLEAQVDTLANSDGWTFVSN